MQIHEFVDEGLGQSSYVIDLDDGTAAIIDPPRFPIAHEQLAAGGVVVDARPAASFSAGHVPGSLSNTLRPVFASWLGWLVEPDQQPVFTLDHDQDRADLVRQCLDGGPDTWSNTTDRPLAVGE